MKRKPRNNGVRDKLLEEGVSYLSEHGYHGTGLKQILDAAAVPKGSFYHYFRSKDHYGAQVLEHYTDKVVAECDFWLARVGLLH